MSPTAAVESITDGLKRERERESWGKSIARVGLGHEQMNKIYGASLYMSSF